MTVLGSLLLLIITIVLYEGSRWLQKRSRSVWANPLLLTTLGVLLLVRVLEVPIPTYRQATKPLTLLMAPSVVALALVLDRKWLDLQRMRRLVIRSLFLGSVLGVLSVGIVAWWCGASLDVLLSLLPKSATTAVAAPVAERLGAIPALAAVVVLCVGIFGALVGPSILDRVGVTDAYARGLALGAASHIVGTMRAKEEGEDCESAATIATILHGVFTALLALGVGLLLRLLLEPS